MLIHATSHEGKRIALNTANIISLEPFNYEEAVRSATASGPDLTTLVALGRLQQDRAKYEKARCMISMTNGTTLLTRDSFQEICQKFSLVSDPVIPSH